MDEKKPKKKRSSKLPVFLTYKEYSDMIIPNTKSIHHKIGIMLAFESGLRISEVIALKQEDIDMEEKIIRVIGGKGNKDRITILPRHWHEDDMKYIPLACSKRALQTAFMTACIRSGLKDLKPCIHFHSLRHSWATFCHENGVKIEYISEGLGHSDISTTMIYTHMSPKKEMAALRAVW